MDRVDIKLGFACNNRCLFCVQGNKRATHAPRPIERIRADLAIGRERGSTGLVVTGGEPTLCESFLDVVRLARLCGYSRIQIQTNGRRLSYEPFCRATIRAGANEFSPALHGSTADLHDGLTRAAGSFEQTVAAIRNLVRLGQTVITNTVVTSRNYRDLPVLARLLVSLGVTQFQFAFVHIVGTAAENRAWLVPRKTDVIPFVVDGLEVGRRAGIPCLTEAIPFCLLPGYEDHVAERLMPETVVFDADKTIDDYGRYRRDEGKTKALQCRQCRWDLVCEGPWHEYPELFGWDELRPVDASGPRT